MLDRANGFGEGVPVLAFDFSWFTPKSSVANSWPDSSASVLSLIWMI
jgi:hypothetical protein